MRNRIIDVLIVIVALSPVSVYALGLGELKLNSYLSQPLSAEIELVGVEAGDGALIEARVASQADHQKAGLERSFSLSGLRFNVLERADGVPYIEVSSQRAVKDPYFDFLLELSAPEGRVMRHYTVLLDPPPQPAAPSVRTAALPSDNVVRVPVANGIASAASLEMPGFAGSAAGQYGPTEIGDTLWEIALEVRPQGVSVNQAMIAIVDANPHAFVAGNVNRMLAGKTLVLPSAEQYSQLDTQQAKEEFVRQQQEWLDYKQGAPAVPAIPALVQTSGGVIERGPVSASDTAEVSAAGSGRVRLLNESGSAVSGSGGAGEGSSEQIKEHIELLEENLEVRERENSELRTRIAELEKQLATLREMVEISQLPPAEETFKPEMPAVGGAEAGSEYGDQAIVAPVEPMEQPSDTAQSEPAAKDIDEVAEDGAAEEPVAESGESTESVATGREATDAQQERVRPRPVAPPAPSDSGGIVSLLMDNLLYVAGAILIIVLAVVGLALRGSKGEKKGDDALDLDDEEATVVRTPSPDGGSDNVDDEATQVVASGDDSVAVEASAEEDTASFLDDFVAPTVGVAAETELEDVDPIAEADVFLTYGHHEQAEDIILDAVQYDDRVDLKLKLLDIYYGQEKGDEYEQYATEYQDQLSTDQDSWEKVIAFGKALKPGSTLFAGATLDPQQIGSLVTTTASFEDELDLDAELGADDRVGLEDVVDDLDLDDFGTGADDGSAEDGSDSVFSGLDLGEADQSELPSVAEEETRSEISTSIDLDEFSGLQEAASAEPDEEDFLSTALLSADALSAGEDVVAESDELLADDLDAPLEAIGEVGSEESDNENTVEFDGLDFDSDLGPDDALTGEASSELVLEEDENTVEFGEVEFGTEAPVSKISESDDSESGLDFELSLEGDEGGSENLAEETDSFESGAVETESDDGQDDEFLLDMDFGDSVDAGVGITTGLTDDNVTDETSPPVSDDEALEFDVDSLAIEQPGQEGEEDSLALDSGLEDEIILGDEDDGLDATFISIPEEESDVETIQNLDAIASQLDLLAAYVDMGDRDQAIPLNEQIQSYGNDQQKKQAAELIARLDD